MLRENRIQKILEELYQTGKVSVTELVERLGVSDMTIRRDLNILEQRGVIERVHGGAIVAKSSHLRIEPPVIERMGRFADEKKKIAEWVAGSIQTGETIFLGSGSTTIFLARELIIRDDIKVVTNSIPIIYEIANNSNIELITIGGFLRRGELSLIGAYAEATLSDLHVSKAIVGMRGIHPLYGFTCENPQELLTDRKIFEMSENIIVIADHTKIGHVATNRVAPIEAAKMIVTSAKSPENLVDLIRARGVKVVLV